MHMEEAFGEQRRERIGVHRVEDDHSSTGSDTTAKEEGLAGVWEAEKEDAPPDASILVLSVNESGGIGLAGLCWGWPVGHSTGGRGRRSLLWFSRSLLSFSSLFCFSSSRFIWIAKPFTPIDVSSTRPSFTYGLLARLASFRSYRHFCVASVSAGVNESSSSSWYFQIGSFCQSETMREPVFRSHRGTGTYAATSIVCHGCVPAGGAAAPPGATCPFAFEMSPMGDEKGAVARRNSSFSIIGTRTHGTYRRPCEQNPRTALRGFALFRVYIQHSPRTASFRFS